MAVLGELPCEICRSPDDEDSMLLCEKCEKGYHMACLSPPLSALPEEDWVCKNCGRCLLLELSHDGYLLLTLLTPFVDEDDALAFALTCTAVRDAIFVRFVRKPLPGYSHLDNPPESRIRTRYSAICSVARLHWADELSRCVRKDISEGGGSWSGFVGPVAKSGSLELLRLAFQIQPPNQFEVSRALEGACSGGHIHVLEVLAQDFQREFLTEVRDYTLYSPCWWAQAAAGSGHVHVFQWLKQHGMRMTQVFRNCYSSAASNGHVPVMQWLDSNGIGPDGWDMRAALLSGRTEAAAWLWEHGLRYGGEESWEDAIQGGQVASLEFILAKRVRLPADALTTASIQGRVHVLEWLTQHGCPWPVNRSEICTSAANHFDGSAARKESPEKKEARKAVRLWNREKGCTCEACA